MHFVELVKGTSARRWDQSEKRYVGEQFDPGERVIMVDGARWGRTRVTHHGCWGTQHTFQQDGGETISAPDDLGEHRTVVVRSRIRFGEDTRPTMTKVLEQARELIAQGRLRDPEIVREEGRWLREKFAKQAQAAAEALDRSFRERAAEAVGINVGTNNEDEIIVIDRVVEAMRWAQKQ